MEVFQNFQVVINFFNNSTFKHDFIFGKTFFQISNIKENKIFVYQKCHGIKKLRNTAV